jgi:O-antigen ligase
MIRHIQRRFGKPIQTTQSSVWIPPARIEYTYYFVIFYSHMSGALGIEVSLIAAGLTVALAGFCYVRLGSRFKQVCAPIKLLLACQISFILVEIAVHGMSPMDDTIRSFILWICGMIVVQSLCLRQGFLLRCSAILFFLGLITIPYVGFSGTEIERAAVNIKVAGNLTNANGLAGWFGFCVVFFAIFGLETKGMIGRIFCWTLALGSLLIVGLTVSRGALLGIALALTFAFRRFLGRGFAPVVLLIVFTPMIYASGVFDQVISRYEDRAAEESGRERIWPAAIDQFLASPLIGRGTSVVTDVEGQRSTPHNSFLYFGLTSGVVPLALWVAFWIRAGRSSSHVERSAYGPYRMPFLLYALTALILGDIVTAPWVLLSLSVGAGPAISYKRGRATISQRIQLRTTARSRGSIVQAYNQK